MNFLLLILHSYFLSITSNLLCPWYRLLNIMPDCGINSIVSLICLELLVSQSLRRMSSTATSRLYTPSAHINLHNLCHLGFRLLLCFKMWSWLLGFEMKSIHRSWVRCQATGDIRPPLLRSKKFKRHPCPFALHCLYAQKNIMLTSCGSPLFLIAADCCFCSLHMEDSHLTETFRFFSRNQ